MQLLRCTGAPHLYGKTKTPAKARTREWPLSNAACPTSEQTQISIKSKARTAASGMRAQARVRRQGAGHGAVQLTFDDDEVKEDREEEVGLHTDGARTHHACCGRLRANPRQLQLPRMPLLARRLEAAAMQSKFAAAVLATSAAAVLIEERAGMPLEPAGDSDEAAEAALAIPTVSGLKCWWPASGHRSRPRRRRGRPPCWWWPWPPWDTLRRLLDSFWGLREGFASSGTDLLRAGHPPPATL